MGEKGKNGNLVAFNTIDAGIFDNIQKITIGSKFFLRKAAGKDGSTFYWLEVMSADSVAESEAAFQAKKQGF